MFLGPTVLFRVGQEHRHAQSSGQLAHVRHPGVGLRHDPFRADPVRKRVAWDDQFRCDDPVRPGSCGGRDRRLYELPVVREIAWNRREVSQGNT